jgi:hypothetical protein
MEETVKGVKKKKDWVNERKQDFMKSRVRGGKREKVGIREIKGREQEGICG